MENKLIKRIRASVIRAIYFFRDENHTKWLRFASKLHCKSLSDVYALHFVIFVLHTNNETKIPSLRIPRIH